MRIYVAGIKGMAGSAVALEASNQGHEVIGKDSNELDLTDRQSVFKGLMATKPDSLVIAAAKVGGIGVNSSLPTYFLSINLEIQTNLLDAAHAAKIEKVLFLGSSCIYPKLATQPIVEAALLTGPLEPTNEFYAIAKIAWLKLVEGYRRQIGHYWIAVMPTNLYGPRDNFDLEFAHVLPALIHRLHNAKNNGADSVTIWGDGTPLREFLHVNDLARAFLVLLSRYDESVAINIGSGQELSIKDLAHLVAKIVGFSGGIIFDLERPNGTPRKLLDSTRIEKFGWKPQINLETGIASTYDWFLANHTKESKL